MSKTLQIPDALVEHVIVALRRHGGDLMDFALSREVGGELVALSRTLQEQPQDAEGTPGRQRRMWRAYISLSFETTVADCGVRVGEDGRPL